MRINTVQYEFPDFDVKNEVNEPIPPFDRAKYASIIEKSSLLQEYEELPTLRKAKDISHLIFDAIQDSLDPDANCGILINSSTGKDSTLVTALYVESILSRLKAGKPVVPAVIAVSDTGSEFPHMASRMQEEVASLNRFAQEQGLAISAEITRPAPKHRLLVELIGNGLALPQLRNGKSASGYVGGSWCMDRVKAGPLGKILTSVMDRYSFVVQCVGVRMDESSRRAGKIDKYSQNLPFGLTLLGDQAGVDQRRIGAMPIVHWQDREMRVWMHVEKLPWNPDSSRKLKAIYAIGTKGSSEDAGECAITVTKDGAVSNVCSDLSGSRFGCWMCLLSTNKSVLQKTVVTARKRVGTDARWPTGRGEAEPVSTLA